MSKLRQQIKVYVAGQLDACTQPDPENPKALFKVDSPFLAHSPMLVALSRSVPEGAEPHLTWL